MGIIRTSVGVGVGGYYFGCKVDFAESDPPASLIVSLPPTQTFWGVCVGDL